MTLTEVDKKRVFSTIPEASLWHLKSLSGTYDDVATLWNQIVENQEICRKLEQYSIDEILEKAEKWNRLQKAFVTPPDWDKIEYFAVSEVDKENTHVAHFDIHTEQIEQENRYLKELNNGLHQACDVSDGEIEKLKEDITKYSDDRILLGSERAILKQKLEQIEKLLKTNPDEFLPKLKAILDSKESK